MRRAPVDFRRPYRLDRVVSLLGRDAVPVLKGHHAFRTGLGRRLAFAFALVGLAALFPIRPVVTILRWWRSGVFCGWWRWPSFWHGRLALVLFELGLTFALHLWRLATGGWRRRCHVLRWGRRGFLRWWGRWRRRQTFVRCSRLAPVTLELRLALLFHLRRRFPGRRSGRRWRRGFL